MRALGLTLLALAAHAVAGPDPAVRLQALITDDRLAEISGLAASRRHPGILWVHNDGGNAAELYAINDQGELRATLRLSGIRNIDWEDLAPFDWEGEPYLLIADVGDNGGLRKELTLHAVREPQQLSDVEVPVAWTQRFRWPDGARDCEAMAVESRDAAIYLVSKKRVPPELFRLPLGPNDTLQTARRIGTLEGIEQPMPDDLRRNPVYGRYRAQITAADIAPDGTYLAVLNYRRVYLWHRAGRDWGRALQAPPSVFEFPWLAQAEALGFDSSGDSLWISSEKLPAPLLQLPLSQR